MVWRQERLATPSRTRGSYAPLVHCGAAIHGSLCLTVFKSYNQLVTELGIIDERDFVIFEFKMRSGWIYIRTTHKVGKWFCRNVLSVSWMVFNSFGSWSPVIYLPYLSLRQSYDVSSTKHKPEIRPPHRRQVVHPRPQTPQEESVAKPETLLLIILSIVYKYDLILHTFLYDTSGRA